MAARPQSDVVAVVAAVVVAVVVVAAVAAVAVVVAAVAAVVVAVVVACSTVVGTVDAAEPLLLAEESGAAEHTDDLKAAVAAVAIEGCWTWEPALR